MQLTEHFSLAEMTVTNHRSIDNTLDPNNKQHAQIIENLRTTATGLEIIRQRIGIPIIVTSGWRCLALNTAIGSKPTSAHISGYAADWICPSWGSPLAIAKQLATHPPVQWDQLIYEHPMHTQWVHISFAPRMRNEVLTIDHLGTHVGIVPPYAHE